MYNKLCSSPPPSLLVYYASGAEIFGVAGNLFLPIMKIFLLRPPLPYKIGSALDEKILGTSLFLNCFNPINLLFYRCFLKRGRRLFIYQGFGYKSLQIYLFVSNQKTQYFSCEVPIPTPHYILLLFYLVWIRFQRNISFVTSFTFFKWLKKHYLIMQN